MAQFDFKYDFTRLSAVKLQIDKITQTEIISVFENHKSKGYTIRGYPTSKNYYSIIGFSKSLVSFFYLYHTPLIK